jgi:hypothetical protein
MKTHPDVIQNQYHLRSAAPIHMIEKEQLLAATALLMHYEIQSLETKPLSQACFKSG